MGKLRRIGMIVFVLAAVLGTGALATLWFAWEPLLPAMMWLMGMPWFYVLEAVLLAITAVGLAVILVSAIVSPSKHSQLSLAHENGSVAITQNAIQSTVKHVIDNHRGLTSDSVHVDIKGSAKPRVSIRAKVDPGRNADLEKLGATLQKEIGASVQAFTGHPVEKVDVTFSGSADVVTPQFTRQATMAGPKAAQRRAATAHAQ